MGGLAGELGHEQNSIFHMLCNTLHKAGHGGTCSYPGNHIRKLKQEDKKLKVTLGCMTRSCLKNKLHPGKP